MASFNSTLVQLKGCLLILKEITVRSFNSTLVQLKVMFWGIVSSAAFCFNSTLVQLKVYSQFRQLQKVCVSILP